MRAVSVEVERGIRVVDEVVRRHNPAWSHQLRRGGIRNHGIGNRGIRAESIAEAEDVRRDHRVGIRQAGIDHRDGD